MEGHQTEGGIGLGREPLGSAGLFLFKWFNEIQRATTPSTVHVVPLILKCVSVLVCSVCVIRVGLQTPLLVNNVEISN